MQIFKFIDMDKYKIPFASETFDFVFSDQVFEHVQNYEQVLSEILRVLKPSGWSLHIFPSRYRIVEPHTRVPFATILQGLSYLRFWALLGIRNEFQRGLGFRETAEKNFNYLKTKTNYLPKTKLRAYLSKVNCDAAFVENTLMKCYGGILQYIGVAPFTLVPVSALAFRVTLKRKR